MGTSLQPLGPNWGQGLWGAYGTVWGSEPFLSLPTSYYLNLLTSQYRGAPNLNAFLALFLSPLQDIATCLETFSPAFDVDYAVGVQLDTLGAIVNVSRTVSFQPSNSVSPVLNDATYRLLIKATIGKNQWNGLLDSLQPLWATLFPGGAIFIDDGLNMTATVLISGAFNSIIVDLITHDYIVPRPQAVQYTYVVGTTPFFGVDYNNSYIAGVDTGYVA